MTKSEKTFTPVTFKGVGVIDPNGSGPERRLVHPNAAPVWKGRLG